MKLARLIIIVLCGLLISMLPAYAESTSTDIEKIFKTLNDAKSVEVSTDGLQPCSYMSNDPKSVSQVIDILKKANIQKIPENLWFFGGTYYQGHQFDFKGNSYVTVTLKNGQKIDFRFQLYYVNEDTVDAAIILPNQQGISIVANWLIHRDLYHWIRKSGIAPVAPLEKVVLTAFDIELGHTYEEELKNRISKQHGIIMSCNATIKKNSPYRDHSIKQTCDLDPFFQDHPDVCFSYDWGWKPDPELEGK